MANRGIGTQPIRNRRQHSGVLPQGAAGPGRNGAGHRDTFVSALCRELGINLVTLYRCVGPQGQLREQGEKVLAC